MQARSAAAFIVVAPGETAREGASPHQVLEDLDGTLLALWPRSGAESGRVLLVRPDRFVARDGSGHI
jgi:hypothetical protein